MKSVESSWVDCSDACYNTVRLVNVDPLYTALEEAKNAIEIVTNAGDIGTLSIAVTLDRLEELNKKRRKLVSFCNAIHYEISDIIDNPFGTRMSSLMQSAYDLDPANFETTTGSFLWFDTKTSLADLILSTMTDEALKSDYTNKVKGLNDDNPSETLTDAIEEARFWQQEFEASEACEQIAEEVFTEDVVARWPNMTEDERREHIQNYANRIGMELYGRETTELTYELTDPNSYGETGPGLESVSLNQSFITDPSGEFSLDNVIDTTTHEVRHQYQYSARSFWSDTPESIKSDWNHEPQSEYSSYYRSEREKDARAFAAMSSPD